MDRAQSNGLWEEFDKLFFVGYSVTVVVIVVFLKVFVIVLVVDLHA